MPSPRFFRPIGLLSARQFSSTPYRLLHSPFNHQHHHRRTTTTLRPSAKSAFLAGLAIAFGAAIWLRLKGSADATINVQPRMGYAAYVVISEITPNTKHPVFYDYLGCQNIQYEACPGVTFRNPLDEVDVELDDLFIGIFLDADVAGESINGKVVGIYMISNGREATELYYLLQHLLDDWNSKGVLRREGMAVCFISCKDVEEDIWVYPPSDWRPPFRGEIAE